MTDGSMKTKLIDRAYVSSLITINDTYLVSGSYEEIKIRNMTNDFKWVKVIFDANKSHVYTMLDLKNGS